MLISLSLSVYIYIYIYISTPDEASTLKLGERGRDIKNTGESAVPDRRKSEPPTPARAPDSQFRKMQY